jgi:hypothetical protein
LIAFDAASTPAFRFSGEIVDREGRPLDGVGFRVVTSRRTRGGFDSDTRDSITLVNKLFSLAVQDADHVMLLFTRNGYDPVRTEYARPGEYEHLRVVMEATATQGPSTSEARP